MNERQEKSSLAHMAMSVARERRPDENLLFTPGEKVIDVVYSEQIQYPDWYTDLPKPDNPAAYFMEHVSLDEVAFHVKSSDGTVDYRSPINVATITYQLTDDKKGSEMVITDSEGYTATVPISNELGFKLACYHVQEIAATRAGVASSVDDATRKRDFALEADSTVAEVKANLAKGRSLSSITLSVS